MFRALAAQLHSLMRAPQPHRARVGTSCQTRSSADLANIFGALRSLTKRGAATAGALSIADFALASHFSLAPTAGLDLGPYVHVNAWLSRVLSRDSMRRALADAHAAMRSNAA